jgi:hypothetical protein
MRSKFERNEEKYIYIECLKAKLIFLKAFLCLYHISFGKEMKQKNIYL